MIKNIILNFGYVENSQPFFWHFTHYEGYDTRWKAAHSLALDCLLSYIMVNPLVNSNEMPKCCKLNFNDSEANYCRICGRNRDMFDWKFHVEYFKEWLYKESSLNMNDSKLIDIFDNDSNWSFNENEFFGIKEKESLIIYRAETVLPIYLFDNKTLIDDIKDESIKVAYKWVLEEIEDLKNNCYWSFDKFVELTNKNDTDGIMRYSEVHE